MYCLLMICKWCVRKAKQVLFFFFLPFTYFNLSPRFPISSFSSFFLVTKSLRNRSSLWPYFRYPGGKIIVLAFFLVKCEMCDLLLSLFCYLLFGCSLILMIDLDLTILLESLRGKLSVVCKSENWSLVVLSKWNYLLLKPVDDVIFMKK